MTKKKPAKAKRKPYKKSDNATIMARVEEILLIRLDGAQYHDILQYASEKQWNVTGRQVSEYIRRADNLMVERHDKSRKRALARHFAQRAALYARSVNGADYRTALSILADEARLRGLYPAEKQEHKVSGVVKEFHVVTVPAGGSAPDDPPAPGAD